MNKPLRHISTVARWLRMFAWMALLATQTSCDSKPNPDSVMRTPLPPGIDKNTPYGQWWTDKPALFNMSDHLKLAVPPQYQRFWLQRDEVTRAPADITKLPMHPLNSGAALEFHFFLPDFTGFTPQNYEEEFHQDKVYVLIEAVGMGQEKLGATGAFPPNMFQREIVGSRMSHSDSLQIHHGLNCYWPRNRDLTDSAACYFIDPATNQPTIRINVPFPPQPSFVVNPLLQAVYFSPQHGGVKLLWRTHLKHLERWREIDQKIWGFIAEWNLVKPTAAPNIAPTSNSKQ